MRKNFFVAALIAALATACTLSVSDSNPMPAEVRINGQFAPSIANGQLVLSGSGLNNVSAVAIGDSKQGMGIVGRTSSMLVATLPAVLTLPSLLWVSTANAQETPVALNALGTLSVDGTLSVTGKADLGYSRVSNSCFNSNNLCSVDCTGGKIVVAGGCNTNNVPITVNYPSGDSQWTCRTSINANVEAFAICARVTLN